MVKDINQIIGQKGANGLPKPSWTSTTRTGESGSDTGAGERVDPIPVETKSLVNMIFARFMTIYGHKFKSTFQSEEEIRIAKREWALSLRSFSEQELVAAVNRSKEEFVWMPTVAEFLSLLRKDLESYGLPRALAAYQEACRYADHPLDHQWSHPAVYFAGRETDWFRLRTEEKHRVFADFESVYRTICNRVIAGEELDVPLPKGLPDRSSDTLTHFINGWGASQGIDAERAATLLYYLFKPKGSPVRAHFKQISEQRLKEWGLALSLPEDYR